MSMEAIPIPAEIRPLCAAFMEGLKANLRQKLLGVYLSGALTFPETGPVTDVDFHVILKERLEEGEKAALRKMHEDLAQDFPPLGGEMDGYYILVEDSRRPACIPEHQWLPGIYDKSWALHRAHMRRGRCIVLLGPEPLDAFPEPTWGELEQALQHEVDFVAVNLGKYPAYCVLNLCRLMYSFSSRDVVVSKRWSGGWAEGVYPQWAGLIEAALRFYAFQSTPEDDARLQAEVGGFYDFACGRIAEGRV